MTSDRQQALSARSGPARCDRHEAQARAWPWLQPSDEPLAVQWKGMRWRRPCRTPPCPELLCLRCHGSWCPRLLTPSPVSLATQLLLHQAHVGWHPGDLCQSQTEQKCSSGQRKQRAQTWGADQGGGSTVSAWWLRVKRRTGQALAAPTFCVQAGRQRYPAITVQLQRHVKPLNHAGILAP